MQKAERIFNLSEIEAKVLAEVYRQVRKKGEPIDAEIFRVRNRQSAKVIQPLKQKGLLNDPDWTLLDPSLEGIAAVAERGGRYAKKFIEASSTIYAALEKHYSKTPGKQISVDKVRAVTKLERPLVFEILLKFRDEGVVSGALDLGGEHEAVTPSTFFFDLQSLNQYLVWRRDRIANASQRSPFPGAADANAGAVGRDLLGTYANVECTALWEKTLARMPTDPAGAITLSKTLLESVCKAVLTDTGIKFHEADDLPKLYKSVARAIGLDPGPPMENSLRQALSGCFTTVQAISAIRNEVGDAHGKGPGRHTPSLRSAWLTVGLAGVLSAFILSSAESAKRP